MYPNVVHSFDKKGEISPTNNETGKTSSSSEKNRIEEAVKGGENRSDRDIRLKGDIVLFKTLTQTQPKSLIVYHGH